MSKGMGKRGQMTLFIIVGVILVLSVTILALYRTSIIKSPQPETEQSSSIRIYVDDCLRQVALKGVYILGQQGGYIYTDKKLVYKGENATYAYHYYEGKDTTPSITDMENDISAYIENNLNLCLNGFAPYKDKSMGIETGQMKADTTIGIDDISIKLNYPVTVTEGNEKTTVKDYSIALPIRLGYINSVIKLISGKEIEDPDWIDLEYLTTFDVNINVRFGGNGNVLYEITDPKSAKVNNGVYLFNTASRFKE